MAPRGELTPAQHAFIRRQLALIPVYIWLVYSWVNLISRLPERDKDRDFVHFLVQGRIALDHNTPALYDMNRMADIAATLLPTGHRAMYPPVYGPQVSLLFMPFAHLSYVAARNLWLLVTLLIYGVCMYALWRACPRLRDRPGLAALLLVAAPALHYVLGFVQVSALALICVTLGYFALRADRPFLAGLALGSLAYKPPLALALAFVFGLRSLQRDGAFERRIVLGATVAIVVQLGIGAAYWGWSILPTYVRALTHVPGVAQDMEPNKYHMHSWRTFFDMLPLPPAVSLASYIVAALAMCVVAFLAWRARGPAPSNVEGPLALRYAALLIATVLADPHLYAYDLVILIPAFLLLWDWLLAQPDRSIGDVMPRMPFAAIRRVAFNSAFMWLLYICYFSPLFSTTIADVTRVQVSVPIVAALGVVILGVLRSPAPAAMAFTE